MGEGRAGRARRARSAFVAVVGMLVVVTACGDGDGGDDEPGAAEGAATSTSVSVAASRATSTAATAVTTTSTNALTASAEISTGGLGVVRIGATPEAAAGAAGTTFGQEGEPVGASGCHYVAPASGPPGVRFMVADGVIARVDVDSGAVRTLSGAGIGSTRDEIVAMFGDKIRSEARPDDPEGEWLVFVPVDAGDADRRVVFVTGADGTVIRFRAGRVPEVMYAEGCAGAT